MPQESALVNYPAILGVDSLKRRSVVAKPAGTKTGSVRLDISMAEVKDVLLEAMPFDFKILVHLFHLSLLMNI
jgi:hypothetical protein